MNVGIINGSPKTKNSASGELLKDLKSYFSSEINVKDFRFNKTKVDDNTIYELNSCDVLVFSYPLYVDGIPSHLFSCLCQIEKSVTNKDIVIYGIVNSGFYEGKQNEIALQILKNWCIKSCLKWGLGIGVGGGGAISQMKGVPAGRGPKTSLGNALNSLYENIINKSSGENIYISVDFPRFFYKIAAEMAWKNMIKANGKRVKDLNYRY